MSAESPSAYGERAYGDGQLVLTGQAWKLGALDVLGSGDPGSFGQVPYGGAAYGSGSGY